MRKPTRQTWFFDREGYTRFPLYHGTSSYFMDSIRRHGLGGRNVVKEWRALEMYKEAHKHRHGHEPHAYSEGGMWGYGGTYLTPYETRARTFKSELFGLIREDMYRTRRSSQDDLLSRYPEAAACLRGQHKPLVIRLPRIHISNLLGWWTDDPCDGEAMGKPMEFRRALIACENGGLPSSPTPTFRLRNPVYEFDVLEVATPEPSKTSRPVKIDDDLHPLGQFDEWILDFLKWATVQSNSKADSFWKGYIEYTIKYVSNTEINRGFRELGYAFPDGFRNYEPYQRVRWKWRSLAHRDFLKALFDNRQNGYDHDLSHYAELAQQFAEIFKKAHNPMLRQNSFAS